MLSMPFSSLGTKEVQVVARPNLLSYLVLQYFYASVCGLGGIQGKGFPLPLPAPFHIHYVFHTFSF